MKQVSNILMTVGVAITVILIFVSMIWLSAEQALNNAGADYNTDAPMILFIICSFMLVIEVAIWLFVFQGKKEDKSDPRIHDIKRYGPVILLPLLLTSCGSNLEPPKQPKEETTVSILSMGEDTVVVSVVSPDPLNVTDLQKLIPPTARILDARFMGKVAGPASSSKYWVKYTTLPEIKMNKYNDLYKYAGRFGKWTLIYERRGNPYNWGAKDEMELIEQLMDDATIRFWELYTPIGTLVAEGEGNLDNYPFLVFHDDAMNKVWCEIHQCEE